MLYDKTKFEDVIVDEATDPELFRFVETTKKLGPKFGNYSSDKLTEFLDKLYELRKNNSNNSAG